MTDEAFHKAATATYRIDGMGGEMNRRLASITAAKEHYLEAVRFGLEPGEPMPGVEFRATTDDPDGMDRTFDPHIECIERQRVDACIWREKPRWPEKIDRYDLSVRTELAMVGRLIGESCRHVRLICRDVEIGEGRMQPGIACADCDQQWSPAPLIDADPADRELLASAAPTPAMLQEIDETP